MFSFLRINRGGNILSLFLLFCILFFINAVNAQTTSRTITGTVLSQTGDPLTGATVNAVGSTIATTSDAAGKFRITMPSRIKALKISYVGMEDKEVNITDQTNVTINLNVAKSNLNEIVVVGYGTQKKKNVTGAVATFNAESLDERPVTRVDQALVGQMAGVAVKQTSGALGKGMSIQIRGTGSISAGNEPLYVIDGFPLTSASPNGSGNFSTGNPLDNINPNDIESIQVLKDAASAAIYGSRAANGVVLITTKRGKTGRAKVNLNTYVGFSERSRKLDMLSAEEWIDRATEIINAQWVASGAGRTASQTNEQRRVILGLPVGQVNTSYMTDDRWTQPGHPGLRFIDWQDEAFRKGLVQNHQISASGGTDIVKYYVSGNFVRQEGMVINTDFTAYSARANVEVNVTKKLKMGLNLAPTYSLNNDPGVEGKDNILHQMVSFTPVQEDTMGLMVNVGNNGTYRWSTSANSPIGKLKNIIGLTKRFRTLASIFGEYQLVPGLTLRSTINFDNTDNQSKGYTPYIVSGSQTTRAAQLTTLTSGSFSTYRRQTFVQENTVSYNKVLADIHDVSVVAGTSYNINKFDNSSLSSNGGFSNNAITTLNAANGLTGSTTESRNVLMSYFGRVQYAYNNKYLLSASVRRDGSSRFGANSKWGVFPRHLWDGGYLRKNLCRV